MAENFSDLTAGQSLEQAADAAQRTIHQLKEMVDSLHAENQRLRKRLADENGLIDEMGEFASLMGLTLVR
jgi:phage shock protein A